MEAILSICGIAIGVYLWYLQKQRVRVKVSVEVENKPFNSKQENIVYSNPSGSRSIDVSIQIESKHKTPFQIQSFFVAVPKFLRSKHPLCPTNPEMAADRECSTRDSRTISSCDCGTRR